MELYDTQGRLITYPGVHAALHQDGGSDEISVTGLSGLLADDQHVLDTEVTSVAVAKTLFDAYSILMATDDNTPIALTVAQQTLVGRITGGTVTSLTVAEIKTLLGVAAASGLASLNASTKVVEQPASISDHLDNTAGGTDGEVTKASTSNALYDAIRLSRLNILINGGFTINQRGYTSAAVLAAGIYGHDRWKAGSGGGTYSFTQLAGPTTITIAANKTLIQVVEDKMVYGGSYILSWTGTCQARYAINSATPAGSYASSPILITGQTAGTTMSVEFGNGASSGTLGLVQLEPGSVATPFEFRPYELEKILCRRYCYRPATDTQYVYFFPGQCISNTVANICCLMPIKMRTTPALSPAPTASQFWLVKSDGNIQVLTTIAIGAANSGTDVVVIVATVAANMVAGNATALISNDTASALIFDAEL